MGPQGSRRDGQGKRVLCRERKGVGLATVTKVGVKGPYTQHRRPRLDTRNKGGEGLDGGVDDGLRNVPSRSVLPRTPIDTLMETEPVREDPLIGLDCQDTKSKTRKGERL